MNSTFKRIKRNATRIKATRGGRLVGERETALGDSVMDPDPEPHVFGPPGSGSISQRYGSGSGSLPFSHKCVERTRINNACQIKF
jgi:hypothetical protein